MSAKIINIRQDAGFYCNKAMEAFAQKNYFASIKYLNKAETLANHIEKREIYFIQGLMYSYIEEYDRSSEYFLLSAFSLPLQVKAFKSVFENMIADEKLEQAFNYKTLLSYHPGIEKKEFTLIEKAFEKADNEHKPKIREFDIEETKAFSEDYLEATRLFEAEDYEGCLDIMQKYTAFRTPRIKDLICRVYIMQDKYEELISYIKVGPVSIEDKCELIICYAYIDKDTEKQNIINDIKSNKHLTDRQKIKFGLALASVGEYVDAVAVLEEYLKSEPYDISMGLTYSKICINAELYTKAKEALIKYKELASFDTLYQYEELLKLCESATLPYPTVPKVKPISNNIDKKYCKKIQSLLELEDEPFKRALKKHMNHIFWLSTYEGDKFLRNTFFARAAKQKELKDVLDKILISFAVDDDLKQIIIKSRLDAELHEDIIFSKEEMLVGFMAISPKLSASKLYSKVYNLLINKVLDDEEQGLFDFNYFLKDIEKTYGDSVENPYVLAAITTWEIDKKVKRNSIKNICQYYQISEELFWKYYKGED